MKKQTIQEKYDPVKIEAKWQKKWAEEGTYEVDLDKAKNPFGKPQGKPFYNLMMFPYPSAEGLHVGNMYAFTGSDIIGRYQRMQGKEVLEPMGLDGFGIHSENYALKVGRTPQEHARISEANFYRQLHLIGNGFAWSRKLETYDPNYYKWTQWLFIELFKKGLAYRKKAPVNYCPKDKTVLADEQVIDGRCERCGSQVEKKNLEQWFFKITDYADRLLNNIEKLDWSDKVKIAQRNWIGKRDGINITFDVADSKEKVTIFTTTPINFGATFLVVAPEHPLLKKITTPEYKEAVEAYIKNVQAETDIERLSEGKEKTGVFTGSYVMNHVTHKKIPVWVADYVLINYGTGAVQGCPGHDQRDFEFAKKFGIPIPRVVEGPNGEKGPITEKAEQVHTGEKAGKMINSDFLNGIEFSQAMVKTMDYFEEKGWGERVATYHLRDWLISRQRYWGPPIPMIYCEKCGWQPVPEEHLPVLLPETDNWKPTGTGESPLAALKEWVKTTCPNCKGEARRETDVSDTFLDSSWYFLRYLATDRNDIPFPMLPNSKFEILNSKQNQNINNKNSKELRNLDLKIRYSSRRLAWLPVHLYTGGAEHSVLHLLYARFVTMVLKDGGYIDFEEPFAKFRAHGLIIKDGAKMSKSKGNVINPDEYIKKFGADTLRSYLMFLGTFLQGGDFRDTGIEGMHRFLKRIWILFEKSQNANLKTQMSDERKRAMHKTINKVTNDIEGLRYNTAIAALMEWYNFLSEKKDVSQEEIKTMLLLLAPFAPHMTEELFQMINDKGLKIKKFESIHKHSWPKTDKKYLSEEKLTIVVQVNGKMRDTFEVPAAKISEKAEIEAKSRDSERVKKYLEGKKIVKTIYVPGKIINFVVS